MCISAGRGAGRGRRGSGGLTRVSQSLVLVFQPRSPMFVSLTAKEPFVLDPLHPLSFLTVPPPEVLEDGPHPDVSPLDAPPLPFIPFLSSVIHPLFFQVSWVPLVPLLLDVPQALSWNADVKRDDTG